MSQDIVRSFSNASFLRASLISNSERKAMSSDFLVLVIVKHCKTRGNIFIVVFLKKALDYCIIMLYTVIQEGRSRMKYDNAESYDALVKRGLICEIMRLVIQAYDRGRHEGGVEEAERCVNSNKR